MSGYRSLHRETVLPKKEEEEDGDAASAVITWKVASSPCLVVKKQRSQQQACCWRLWAACSDGTTKSYLVEETSLAEKASLLDASALKLHCSHVFVGTKIKPLKNESASSSQHHASNTLALACSEVSLVRNYTGEDDMAGDLIVLTLDLAGQVRIYQMAEDWDANLVSISNNNGDDDNDNESNSMKERPTPTASSFIPAMFEFTVENATGTSAALCPPRLLFGQKHNHDVIAAVPCLDGTIAIVATGLTTPKQQQITTKEATASGTILDRWGSRGSSIPLCLCWHPKNTGTMAVGRQDGVIDILTESRSNQHRLARHKTPVRAIAFTDDGHLLVTGSDSGTILIWDVTRKVPALVHHVMQAHKSWILDIQTLSDSRRFVTCGADRTIHVWNVGQIHQPVHTFQTDSEVWTMARGPSTTTGPRLITGSDDGHLQVYSLEN